jgi:hypothetical protein
MVNILSQSFTVCRPDSNITNRYTCPVNGLLMEAPNPLDVFSHPDPEEVKISESILRNVLFHMT